MASCETELRGPENATQWPSVPVTEDASLVAFPQLEGSTVAIEFCDRVSVIYFACKKTGAEGNMLEMHSLVSMVLHYLIKIPSTTADISAKVTSSSMAAN